MTTGKLSSVRKSNTKLIWPNAGILCRDHFVANNTLTSLSYSIHSDLMELVEKTKPDPRYFLSPNAAEGILRRVTAQNRHLFPPLKAALERLSGVGQPMFKAIDAPSYQELLFPELECV
jgi:DNA (cytosine-5)-methyltransferase 1